MAAVRMPKISVLKLGQGLALRTTTADTVHAWAAYMASKDLENEFGSESDSSDIELSSEAETELRTRKAAILTAQLACKSPPPPAPPLRLPARESSASLPDSCPRHMPHVDPGGGTLALLLGYDELAASNLWPEPAHGMQ